MKNEEVGIRNEEVKAIQIIILMRNEGVLPFSFLIFYLSFLISEWL